MFGIWLRSTFDLPTVNNTVGCKLVAVAGFTHTLGAFWRSLSAFWRSSILLVLSSEFRILAIQVVAEVVDLTIQTINLVLVAWSYDSEVVELFEPLNL